MGEYVSLDMGCTWKFKSSLFNFNELQSLELFSCFVRFQQDREVESRKAHILENGGSNPSPATPSTRCR